MELMGDCLAAAVFRLGPLITFLSVFICGGILYKVFLEHEERDRHAARLVCSGPGDNLIN